MKVVKVVRWLENGDMVQQRVVSREEINTYCASDGRSIDELREGDGDADGENGAVRDVVPQRVTISSASEYVYEHGGRVGENQAEHGAALVKNHTDVDVGMRRAEGAESDRGKVDRERRRAVVLGWKLRKQAKDLRSQNVQEQRDHGQELYRHRHVRG